MSLPRGAHAYSIETLVTPGCHERVSAEALAAARGRGVELPRLPSTTRDERAFAADLPFALPRGVDAATDLGAVALLVGVREPDLRGNEPSDFHDLSSIHASEGTQAEHCLRRAVDDEPNGARDALAACRAFVERELLAAAELAAPERGAPWPRQRVPVFLAVQGESSVDLPAAFVHAGYALHALQDAFTHTYRTDAGREVVTVLNFVDEANGTLVPARDGPAHRAALDACEGRDPLQVERRAAAVAASTDALVAAFSPSASREERAARVAAALDGWMSLREGCSSANGYCGAPEEALPDPGFGGCGVAGRGLAPAATVVLVGLGALAAGRRRRARATARPFAALLALSGAATPSSARADEEPEPAPAPPAPVPPAPPAPVPPAPPAPARPPAPKNLLPTAEREASRLAISSMLGASLDRPAFFVSVGGRYRASERWLVGVDLEWNPWATLHAASVRPGTVAGYATVIHRIPMRSEKLWIRTGAHLGVATLLHDFVGARAGSTGPFVGLSLLGLEIDVGRGLHVVVDPADVCLVVPQLAGTPVVHRQYRLAVGLQFGGP